VGPKSLPLSFTPAKNTTVEEDNPMAFDLTEYAEAINSALADGKPCNLATASPDGHPDIGFKGSMMVFDRDHLAYWERTQGGHLENLRKSPHVAVMYFNWERQLYVRFYGEATIHEKGEQREQIMARVVEPALNYDPERKGFGVLIRVDIVAEPFGRGILSRDD
jgi:general stress protein 26